MMTDAELLLLIIAGVLLFLLVLVAVGWWYGREVDELVDESGEHL
jgi:hypothetical protein